MEIWKH